MKQLQQYEANKVAQLKYVHFNFKTRELQKTDFDFLQLSDMFKNFTIKKQFILKMALDFTICIILKKSI